MTIDYTEKRNYIRMPINHEMTFKLDGESDLDAGVCKNLSADGVLFSTNRKIEPGTIVDINITPKKSLVIPLDAMIEVVRVTPDNSSNNYIIAGIIKQMN